MNSDDWDDDEDRDEKRLTPAEEGDDADETALILIPRFVAVAAQPFWFSTVGQPLNAALRRTGRQWLDGLGFPHADIAAVRDWREAADAAESTGIDDPAFEAEEQL